MDYKKGFTLIELLLVVGIVTLLSSVLFYGTSEAKKGAEDAHMQAESNQVKTALTLYRNDTGRYPLTSIHAPRARTGVVHSESDPDSDYLATMQELVDGGYLSEIPRSPDEQSYAYGVSEDGENAVFAATLKKSGLRSSSSNSCDFIKTQSNAESFEGDCQYVQGSSGCNEPDENGMISCWNDPGQWVCMPEPQPPSCYVIPGTTGTCTVHQSTVDSDCSRYEDQSLCPPPETIYYQVCTPSTPSQTICEGGGDGSYLGTPPRLADEVICGGEYDSDYCQCI